VTSISFKTRPSRALFGQLIRLAWPIAVSTLSYTFMTVVDTWFMGRIGANAIGGVGLGGIAAFTSVCFGFGLLRAVKVLCAQAIGAGARQKLPATVGAGLVTAGLMAVLSLLVGLGILLLLPRLAGAGETTRIAEQYLQIRLCGTPLVLASVALREARYGVSDSRSPMVAALIANLVHIPLNYLLMFGLGLGFRGAAYATLLVQALELALLCVAQRPDGFGLSRVTPRHVREVLRIGVPVGLEFFLGVSAFSLLVILVARMGDAQLAAHQIALQLTHVSFMPALAVGEAASVLSGNAVGAREDQRIGPIALAALTIAGAYTATCALLFLLLARHIVGGFTANEEVIAVGVRLLHVAALFQVFDAVNIVARSVLRGTGDVRFPALVSVTSSWLFIPPLTYWLGMHHGLGAVGGWWAITTEITATGVLLCLRLQRGSWRHAAEQSRVRLAAVGALP
jgi:multidrug resistance protein, MATE family